MLAVMIVCCIHATVTDLRNGIVKNKLLLVGFALSLLFNGVYYLLFAGDLFITYLINLMAMTVLSVAFYALHFWAAGDSKLLIFVVSMLPARIWFSGVNVAATVLILISIFSLAFLYYVAESVVIGLREKNLFSFRRQKLDLLRMAAQYVKCACLVTVANYLYFLVFPGFYMENTQLFMIVNMLLVFAVCQVKWLDRWYVLAVLMATALCVILLRGQGFQAVNLYVYGLVLLVIFLRSLAEKYNYKTIPTAQVKPGMVLSLGTVMLFLPSRIKGLPSSTTEDIRSRLTPEQAESVRRWETSKYGQEQVTIVRKIPFAIFIFVGTLVFIIVRIIA